MQKLNKPFGVVIAGVGGQGALTIAALLMEAAAKAGFYPLQSEIHGMSQRGGSVNAQVLFDSHPVTSPMVTEGAADLLIGLEPLETLRYLSSMKKNAEIITSIVPIKNMANYPDIALLLENLKKIKSAILMDTEAHVRELNNKHAGNITVLGKASTFMPIPEEVWEKVFTTVFAAKGTEVIAKNWQAFQYGRKL